MPTQKATHSAPLTEDTIRRAKRARETYGLNRCLRSVKVAEHTWWRGEAGGTLHSSTQIAFELGLDTLEAEAP